MEGQLTHDASAPPGGGALRFSLRQSVELFPAGDGSVYLLRTGGEPTAAIRNPSPEDRALLEALPEGVDALPGSEAAERLEPLVRAGLVRAGPPPAPLPEPLAARFERQLPYLADFGDPGELQQRLRAARVTVLGCGGLGTWALAGLASAGVGRFMLVDDDSVELGNLNRQILYAAGDVGVPKTTAAARWLRAFDPAVEVVVSRRRVESVADVEAVAAGSDLLVLAADWPPYALGRWVNEACVGLRIPFLTAGQQPPLLKVGPAFLPGAGPCFACQERQVAATFPLYPELAAHRERHPAPATTLGPASAIVGSVLAMEAMHLLLDVGPPATTGRALLLDMRTLATRWETYERDPTCPICGPL